MKNMVIASASPRRAKILRDIGISFDVVYPEVDEAKVSCNTPSDLVQKLAYEKANNVSMKISKPSIVIGADTIVYLEEVIGKPKDDFHAFELLKKLQGTVHDVFTGISVIDSSTGYFESEYERTKVYMRCLTDENILNYIKTGETKDKAGGYGIQGIGALLVERIEGCYFNVVGLPVQRLNKLLLKFGIKII